MRKVFEMRFSTFVYRCWYYFRLGYSTYLTFMLGLVSTLVTVYYLAIKNWPYVLSLFPQFAPFAIMTIVVGVPLSILIGWVHMKRSSVWKAEMDIGVEANPYYYKLPPGYYQEAWTPAYLEILRGMMALLEKEKLLKPEDRARLSELEKKLEKLISGGYVGAPRRKIDF